MSDFSQAPPENVAHLGATQAPAIRWLVHVLEVVCGVLLLIIVVSVTLGIVTRYVVKAPMGWTTELAQFAFLWLIFLGVPAGIARGSHIAFDSLAARLPSHLRILNESLVKIVTSVFLVALLHNSLQLIVLATGLSPALIWPDYVRYITLPIGAVLSLVIIASTEPIQGRDAVVRGTGKVVLGALVYAAVFLSPLDQTILGNFSPTVILLASFTLFLVGAVPISFAMVIAAFLASRAGDLIPSVAVAQQVATGADQFVLLAIPLFIFASSLMNAGGVTRTILDLAAALVGHVRGGLAHVNILSGLLFSGMSGSSSADASAMSKMLVPEMTRRGYGVGYSAAVTASSAILANIIPPSIAMLVYASLANVSVGKLFIAGYVPGLLLATALFGTAYVVAVRRGYGADAPRPDLRRAGGSAVRALPALMLPLMIVGGLRAGVFTASEAGAAAAIYALILGVLVYRGLTWRSLYRTVADTAVETSTIGLLLTAAAPFAWVLIAEQVPQNVSAWALGLTSDPVILMLTMNLIMVIVGLPLELGPAMLILMPVFLPVTMAVGIDPVHFGVVVITNLMIGAISPPVGGLVFITAYLCRVPAGVVFREVTPFMLAMLGVVLLLIWVPGLSTGLADLLGGF